MREKVKNYLEQVMGIKLRYRMFMVYILGGILPIILIGMYLIHGTADILIEEAERREVTELEMIRSQAEEIITTVSTVTKYFYFDAGLEKIAGKQYRNYQEVVDDYKAYTGFLDYTRYYNSVIGWINIYMENDTIVENSRFGKVTGQMEKEEWYQAARERNGSAIWRLRPLPSDGQDSLTMLRMLKTEKGENVGILSIYIRPERFLTLLQERDCDMFVLLNGRTLVADTTEGIEADDVLEYLPHGKAGQIQQNIILGKQEYVMTCETIDLAESQDYLQVVSLRAYADILHEVNRKNAQSIVIFAISVIVSVSVILGFSHSFSSRVERFRTQMQRAAEGNFELEESIGGSDEISSLYGYLGTMIGEIQRLLSEIYREKLHAERLTIQQKDAEFKMLASQINPHFLYNTLETIRMRARRSKQGDIEEIVKMLAKIMRSYIQVGGTEASIRSEIELVEYYLKIQQYRFEERIHYQIEIDPELLEYKILPLVMQPVVENSIIHGLERKEGDGSITITIHEKDGKVIISIRDDGMGIPADKLESMRRNLNRYDEKGRHIGVANVHQRVKSKYGDAYGVEIESVEGAYTKVDIILPAAGHMDEDGGGKGHYEHV